MITSRLHATRDLPGPTGNGTGRTGVIPRGSLRLFRGWQVNPNSIFCDGLYHAGIDPRQQMESGSAHRRNPAVRLNRRCAPLCTDLTKATLRARQRATPSALLTFLIMDVPVPNLTRSKPAGSCYMIRRADTGEGQFLQIVTKTSKRERWVAQTDTIHCPTVELSFIVRGHMAIGERARRTRVGPCGHFDRPD